MIVHDVSSSVSFAVFGHAGLARQSAVRTRA